MLVDPELRSVLLVDHRDAGLWLATGGHVGVGETPERAAAREIREELGVGPRFLPSLGERPLFISRTRTQAVSAGHTDVSLWFVFGGSEGDVLSPDPREFATVRWWPMDRIRHDVATRFDPNLPRFIEKLSPLLR